MENSPSPNVARLGIWLAAAAGYGCFVRGMLLSHYLPFQSRRPGDGSQEIQRAFDEMNSASPDVRDAFSRLIARAIVYDSYRNLLQGLLFRRLLKSMLDPKPSWNDRLEANLTTLSVLSRTPEHVFSAPTRPFERIAA